MAYTSESISRLKDQVNIVDVIGRAITLKKTGASYKGVCPFHKEKTPSFNVNESRQMFYCFGCRASGDVIEFEKRFYNLEFNEAVERLSSEYGIQLEEIKSKNENLDKYYVINRDAANFFLSGFTSKANIAYPYMKKRGIDDATLKKFGIGYADEGWSSLYDHLKSLGHDEKDMLDLGLISQSKGKYYDKFRNRVIFPIINTRRNVIGFGGRAINPDDNPKYLNSQESKVFLKKNNLYGLNFAKDVAGKLGYIILVEGYMDVISLYQHGIQNVAASLGTALTDSQGRMLKRYAKKVVLCYDSDNAGRQAALRGMDILRNEGIDVRVMHVTDGKDPDEFISKNGKEAFLELVENAMHYGDYKIADSIRGLNLEDHHDRIKAIKNIAAIIRNLSPGEKEEYASKAAEELGISKAVILEEASGTPSKELGDVRKAETTIKDNSEEKILQTEAELIALILRNSEYINRVKNNIDILRSDISKKIFSEICDIFKDSDEIDTRLLMDNLEDNERTVLLNILGNTYLSGDDEKIYKGILKRDRLMILQSEVERINDILRYGGESEDDVDLSNIMKRSMELQEEIAKIKAEEE